MNIEMVSLGKVSKEEEGPGPYPIMALSLIFPLNQVAAEKMTQALAERSHELQLLRQHVLGKDLVGTQSAGARPLKQDKQPIQVRIMH